jgi:hypothetical protein
MLVANAKKLMEPGYHSQYIDSLRAGRSGDITPVGATFSAPTQIGPGVQSNDGNRVSFPEVKSTECGVDHPPPSSAEIKERVQL